VYQATKEGHYDMVIDVYFTEAHRAHQAYVPGYWRADCEDGRYYTEMECEVSGRDEFAANARRYFETH
jgi:hypothetical protein